MSHSPLTTNRARRWSAIAYGVVLMACVLAGERATASCGDYVHVGNPRGANGMPHGLLNSAVTGQLAGHAGAGDAIAPVGPVTPCQGPHCRPVRSEPAAPAPVPTSPPQFDAWLVCEPVVAFENSLRVEFLDTLPPVLLSRRGPFRPPRAV